MSKPLSYYAYYVNNKVDSNTLTTHNYIGVDNMLPNKRGVIDSEYVPSGGTSTAFEKGDILIGNIRPYFKKIWLATFDGGCSPDVLCIRPNEKMIPECLYAVLSQDTFFDYNMAGSKGSKMPRGDKDHIMAFPIAEIKDQDSVGVFITNLYNKIINNSKINAELESMAKTLYDYWFLQFEFPNEEGKPYKSSGGKMVWNDELKREIPDGWAVENLMETSICEDIKAGVEYFDTKNYLPTANINGETITDGENVTYDNRENRANMQPIKYSVWFAKMKNSIKHLSIPNNSEWFINKYILSTGFQGLKCSEDSFSFVHCVVNSSWFETYKDVLSHGATQESVNNEDLKNIKFAVPTNKILKQFSKIVLPMLERKFTIVKENQELTSLRDFLLPLLMNGQVTFKDESYE